MDKKLSAALIKSQQKKLLEEKEKLAHQIQELKKSDPFMDPDHSSDNAAVDTDAREQIGHQTIEAEIEEMKKRLKDIDLALSKAEKGGYGLCEKCNKLIPLKRIELIPEARFCVECEGKLRR